MRNPLRATWLVAWTPMLEAWRRREIYAIVIVTTCLIVGLRLTHFFHQDVMGKFYREVSLKAMNVTTAATIILLAARQLPREFSLRTIYPLLAKPITRLEFLLGKYLGVLAAGLFCYGLFMVIFTVGSVTLHAPVQPVLFLQSIYLECLSFAVLAAMVFMLSMVLNTDAAITLSALLFLASQILMNLMELLYDTSLPAVNRWALLALHFLIPQLTLFDASSKVVHSVSTVLQTQGPSLSREVWGPLPAWVLSQLTLYAAVYIAFYLAAAYLCFRRRPL